MAKQFKADDLFIQFGTASSRTAAAGSPITTAIPQDGMQLSGSGDYQDLPTDHGQAGTLLRYRASRNGAAQSVQWYPFPLMAGTLFDCAALAQTDQYAEIRWHKGNGNLSSSDVNGREFFGCTFDGFSFGVDRSGTSNPITIDTPVYVNSVVNRVEGTDTVPSLPSHTILPWFTGGALIDWKHNAADTFGADHPEVIGVNINYSRGTEVAGFAASSTAAQNDTWTRIDGYDLSLTVDITINLDGDDTPFTIDELSTVPDAALRLALTHPSADTATTADPLTAGTGSEVVDFDDASEFLAGDVCILTETGGDWTACVIDSISTDAVTFDLDATPNHLAISGSGTTIQNMAGYFYVPRLSFSSISAPVRNGRKRSQTISYQAVLGVGETSLMTVYTYDHPESRL